MRLARLTSAASAYARPTVCMIPWQFGSRKPPSRHAEAAIAATAGRGSASSRTMAVNARV